MYHYQRDSTEQITRTGLRKKVEELDEAIRRFQIGKTDFLSVMRASEWFIAHNIPFKYFEDGVKIMDETIKERFIPLEDEALLEYLNDLYVENKAKFHLLRENSEEKRKIKRIKGMLSTKYVIEMNQQDIYYIVGTD